MTAGEELGSGAVRGGKVKSVPYGSAADVEALLKNGETLPPPELKLPEKLKAPISRGEVIGRAEYSLPGGEKRSVDLVALCDVQKASIWDNIKDIFD